MSRIQALTCVIDSPYTYVALRIMMEELLGYFDNVQMLRIVFPVGPDLDPSALIGKLTPLHRQ